MAEHPELRSADELATAFAEGSLSPVEVTEAALAAIERYDEQVNAILFTDADGALEQARAAESRWRDGQPLSRTDGIPITVKDMFLVKGWPTVRGSSLIDPEGPWEEDAPAVARLRESGGVLLGKNTTPEFAWKGVTDSGLHGATGNPWAPRAVITRYSRSTAWAPGSSRPGGLRRST